MVAPDDPRWPGSPPPADGAAPLVLLGASVRAFAQSAVRCGWAVHAADLFADLDLVAVAREAVAVGDAVAGDAAAYPWSLRAAAARFPPCAAWCYTGALENHPELIAAIAATRPLAGNPPAAVRRLRDRHVVAAAARAAGLAAAETFDDPAGLPVDGTFLVKPVAGAGGRGIRPWTARAAARHALESAAPHGARGPRQWQRLVAGAPWSATFVLGVGGPRCVGVARQLVGAAWCRAAPFAWCGAVAAPARLAPAFAAAVARLGPPLATGSGGAGLVGVDLIVDDAGRVHVIEVNPRPTASMELFERTGELAVAADHLAACGIASPVFRPPAAPTDAVWSKAVLFARPGTRIDAPTIEALRRESRAWTDADGGWPALADVPRPGQSLPGGAPVLTAFARGPAPAESLAALRSRIAVVDALLRPDPACAAAVPDDA